MSRDNYEEFPELTPEALEALRRAEHCLDVSKPGWNRRYLAAFLLEATKQAHHALRTGKNANIYESLQAIANNLHSPPPPPPTLAQAREADLSTPAGKDLVRAFLATLGEGTQP